MSEFIKGKREEVCSREIALVVARKIFVLLLKMEHKNCYKYRKVTLYFVVAPGKI